MTNPTISIIINDEETSETTAAPIIGTLNNKCQSMLNLDNNKTLKITRFDKFKTVNNNQNDHNTNINNQYISIYSSSRRLARKCLSRINLNNQINQKNQLDINNSLSIMNLNTHNQKLNKLYYFKSSNVNLNNNNNTSPDKLLKRNSTSLNALLDLDMWESVSIGSFDRHSFYSQCANSECDLSNLCLIESTSNLFLNNHHNQKLLTFNNNVRNFDSKIIINNKVADWLEKI